MKKYVKIILIIVAIVLIGVVYYGYRVYQVVMGSEKITGKQESIPSVAKNIPQLTKGTADWSNWRGQNFDGKNATVGIKKDWANGLKKLWQVDYLCQGKANASWAAPVVKGNRLIVPGRDEGKDLVFCINSETGELIWQNSYPAPAETAHGPGARATPFIDSNRVYTFGRSGDIACWMLEDGKLLWHKNVKDLQGQESQWGLSSTPLVYKNKVIVQGGGKATVIAYDKMTGDVLWKSLEGEAGYAAAIPMTVENQTQLLVYHGKGLSGLNPDDGKEIWRVNWPTEYGVNATTPAIVGDVVFHTSGYKMGCEAIKVRKDGFSVLWKNDVIAAQHSDPIIIDGFIYEFSGESSHNVGEFKCVDLSNGKVKWSTPEMGQGTTVFADGYLFCFNLKGALFIVKPNPDKFEKAGEIKDAIAGVTNPSWTTPCIANGKIYLRYMQRLICYDLM